MKKIYLLIILSIMIFFIASCNSKRNIVQGDCVEEIMKNNVAYISLNTLYAFNINKSYNVIIVNNGVVDRTVVFSKNREASNICNIQLQKMDNLNWYLGKNINEVKSVLGEEHADIGSGFYIPAYITTDGFLISFSLDDDIISAIIKRDLLSNEIIEKIYL